MVYFLFDCDRNLIKIGITQNMPKRIDQHRRREKTGIHVMGVMPGGRAEERVLHYVFSHHQGQTKLPNRGSEWFYPHSDIFRFVTKFTVRWCGERDLEFSGEPDSPHGPWFRVLIDLFDVDHERTIFW